MNVLMPASKTKAIAGTRRGPPDVNVLTGLGSMMRSYAAGLTFLLATVVALSSQYAFAATYQPGDTVPGTVGDVFGWTRGDANSTFNGWDFFENIVAPGYDGSAFTDTTPDILGQSGAVGSFTVNAGVFPVGSGNPYSPFNPLSFSSVVPSGTAGGNSTRIVAQFKTGGSELNYSGILLSADAASAGAIMPSFTMETGRTVTSGPRGGETVEYLALWDIDASQESYRLDFGSTESSLSLQEFRVDSFTRSTPFVTPVAVPEPSTWAAIAVIGVGAMIVRKRRNRHSGEHPITPSV